MIRIGEKLRGKILDLTDPGGESGRSWRTCLLTSNAFAVTPRSKR